MLQVSRLKQWNLVTDVRVTSFRTQNKDRCSTAGCASTELLLSSHTHFYVSYTLTSFKSFCHCYLGNNTGTRLRRVFWEIVTDSWGYGRTNDDSQNSLSPHPDLTSSLWTVSDEHEEKIHQDGKKLPRQVNPRHEWWWGGTSNRCKVHKIVQKKLTFVLYYESKTKTNKKLEVIE